MLDRKSCDPGVTPQGTQTSKAYDTLADSWATWADPMFVIFAANYVKTGNGSFSFLSFFVNAEWKAGLS